MYFRRAQRRHDGQVQQGLESCFVTVVPLLTLAQLQGRPLDEIRPGGLGLHFIQQAMDTVDSPAKGSRIGCASLSIWPTEAVVLLKGMTQ